MSRRSGATALDVPHDVGEQGTDRPSASSLNPSPGQPPTPNAVNTQLSSGGEFSIFNRAGSVDVIVDINGYYTDHCTMIATTRARRSMTRSPPPRSVAHPDRRDLRAQTARTVEQIADGAMERRANGGDADGANGEDVPTGRTVVGAMELTGRICSIARSW